MTTSRPIATNAGASSVLIRSNMKPMTKVWPILAQVTSTAFMPFPANVAAKPTEATVAMPPAKAQIHLA